MDKYMDYMSIYNQRVGVIGGITGVFTGNDKPNARKMLDTRVIWINGLVFLISMLFLIDQGSALSYRYNNRRFDGLPSFTRTPTNVTANRGGIAVLRCGVVNLGTKTVIWRKQPYKVPITVGTDQFLELHRFQLHREIHLDEWNLLIKNTQPFDSGIYECQVSSKDSLIRRNITLTVFDTPALPSTPSITVSGTQFVEKGATIHLVCNASDNVNPPQSIDWFRNGIKLHESYEDGVSIQERNVIASSTVVSALDIKKTRMSDTGVYVCRASDRLHQRLKVDVLNTETYNEKRDTQGDKQQMAASSGSMTLTNSPVIILQTLILTLLLSRYVASPNNYDYDYRMFRHRTPVR